MKKILKLAICTGITFPLIASAQIVVNGPETATTSSGANSSFHNLVIAMSAGSNALFTPEGSSLSVQSPIYFNYNGVNPNVVGTWSASAVAPNIKFEYIPNFAGFNFAAGGDLDVGFIGEESTHNNDFGFVEGGSYTSLFNWNAGGDTAPMSYNLSSATATNIMFRQQNFTVGGPNGIGVQNDPTRFRTYAVLDNGQLTGEYLFAIADRSATKDADFDDGFFYVIGDITPVPEPSHIAALALVGLGGLLYIRRRIRK